MKGNRVLHIPLLHWRLNLSSGMYGDPAVNCATHGCEYSVYTCGLYVAFLRLLHRLPWRGSSWT